MNIKRKIILVAVPLAVLTFFLSQIIWPNPVGMIGPSSNLVPFFILVSILECLAFGIGVAFLIFGWPLLSRSGGRDRLSTLAFLSAVWTLISWWPHDNMHRVNGMDNFSGLLRIELIFHVTLIIAGFIVAKYIWRILSQIQP